MPFWELTEAQREYRLAQARLLSQQSEGTEAGIGIMKERSLHSVLKFYYSENPDTHEIPVGPYIADIYYSEPKEAVEIQTGSFGPLRDKLDHFLAEMPVTIVCPIARTRTLFWSDPQTGELSRGRRSPKKGTLLDILPELYRIRSLLGHPNLSFLPVLVDVHEYRLADGWSRDGKRGSHRTDRLPVAIGPSVLLHEREDFSRLISDLLPTLPHPFTAQDLAKQTGFSPRALSYSISALRDLGVIVQSGKRGRAYLYTLLKN